MMRSSHLAIVLAALVTACDSPPSEPADTVDESALIVEIRSNRDTYRPLDPAIARITNRSHEPVFRDVCSGQIEGRRSPDDDWSGDFGSGWACALPDDAPEPRRIEPGATLSDTLHINNKAYAGEWRFQYWLYDEDGDLLPLEQRVSNIFRVVREP